MTPELTLAATGWELAHACARWIAYSAVLLAVGGALFLTAIHDRRPDERRLLVAVVVGAAVAGAVATVASVLLHAVEVAGTGEGALPYPQVLFAVLASVVGTSALVRLGGLALLLAGLGLLLTDRGTIALLLGGAAAVLSFTLAGHTVTAEPRWLAAVANGCHTLAASVWFGGLVLLAIVLRRRGPNGAPVEGAALVARFSGWATGALLVVVVAGLPLAWTEVRTLEALTSTTYGSLLVAKAALVGAVACVGGYNNRFLVRAVRREEQALAGGAWRRLSLTVRLETLGLLAALAVTAFLVHETPPRPFGGEPVEHAGATQAIRSEADREAPR